MMDIVIGTSSCVCIVLICILAKPPRFIQRVLEERMDRFERLMWLRIVTNNIKARQKQLQKEQLLSVANNFRNEKRSAI